MRFTISYQISCSIVSIICMLLLGCSAHNSLPANWGKDIPGLYEGTSSSFKEVAQFNTNGTYQHEVFDGEKRILLETGKWSISPGTHEINLSPLNSFTEYYDPMSQKFSTNGKPFYSYVYWPLPDGKTFSRISASVEYEYCLVRKKAY